VPGNSGPDGVHYDVHGNLWAGLAGLGGFVEIDPRGLIIGFVPIPNGDAATTNFAFGGPDNQEMAPRCSVWVATKFMPRA
jgi:sugar lactone lactonase YvrE